MITAEAELETCRAPSPCQKKTLRTTRLPSVTLPPLKHSPPQLRRVTSLNKNTQHINKYKQLHNGQTPVTTCQPPHPPYSLHLGLCLLTRLGSCLACFPSSVTANSWLTRSSVSDLQVRQVKSLHHLLVTDLVVTDLNVKFLRDNCHCRSILGPHNCA